MKKLLLSAIALLAMLGSGFAQTFTNVIAGSGIPVDRTVIHGVLDFNKDGFEDLLLSLTSTSGYNGRKLKLYKNNAGNGTFTDVSQQVSLPDIDSLGGTTAGDGYVGIADFNNDGFKDVISVEAGTRLRILGGSVTGNFQDISSQIFVGLTGFTDLHTYNLADINKDGFMDFVFIHKASATTKEIGYLVNKMGSGSLGTYQQLVSSIPLNYSPLFQMFDYDADNDLDIFLLYAQNDLPWPGYAYYYHPIKTYRNNGGTFSEVSTISPVNFCTIGFRPVITDFNQDGFFDVMAGKGDFSPNSSLFLPVLKNLGNGTFQNESGSVNFSTGSCYQSQPIENDYDLDGDLDYWVGNTGWQGNSCTGSKFFQNNGVAFTDVGQQLGTTVITGVFGGYTGGIQPTWFDFDNDGDQDFFGGTDAGSTATCFFFRNGQSSSNKFIKLNLVGCQSGSDAYYTRVKIKANGKSFYRIKSVSLGDNTPQSQLIHFGLGNAATIDSLVVKWPSGQTTVLTNVAVNQTLTVNEGQPVTITASGPLTFCQGGSVTLSTNTTGNQWYRNGTLIANQTGATLVVNSSGSYTVQGTSIGGCTSTSSVIQVTVNTAPPVPVVSANGPLTFCQGGSVTLTNTTSGTKQWLRNNTAIPNQTGNSLLVNTPGSYTLRISNANGCQATSQPSVVVVNTLPVASISPSGPTTFCSGGSVTLTATGGGTYLWSNNQTTSSITVSSSGSYVVTVTTNNCSAKDTMAVVVNPQPVVLLSLPPGNYININQGPWPLNGSPAGGTYSGLGINNGLFNPLTTGLGSTQIGYTYTSAAGCTGSKSEKIIVYDTTGIVCTSYDTVSVSVTDTLFINAVITQIAPPNNRNTIKIYPNPANTHITIDNGNFVLMQGYKIRVTNSLGQEVFFSLATQQQFFIDLSTWTGMGTYFVHLIDDQGNTIQIKKIILQ